jgi:hypothetical protein
MIFFDLYQPENKKAWHGLESCHAYNVLTTIISGRIYIYSVRTTAFVCSPDLLHAPE